MVEGTVEAKEVRVRPRLWEWLALGLVLVLAGYLRFTNLQSNPGWYSDEGTLADITKHLAAGRVQYLALNRSTLLAARLPLVPLLASALVRLGMNPLEALRAIAATSGVLTTGLTYALVRSGPGAGALGLLSALLFAIYPPGVFYSRVGISYNLLTPLVVLSVAGLWLYLSRGIRMGLALAALAIGIGATGDLMMISLAAPLIVVTIVRRARDLGWSIPLLVAPFVLYCGLMLARDPQAFLFDVRFIFGRLMAVPWWAQLPLIAYNFGTLALTDPWWAPAIIGLLLVRPRTWRLLLLVCFLLPLVLLGRTSGLAGLRRYSISPLFPFLALGMANLLWAGVPWILAISREAIENHVRKIGWLAGTPEGTWVKARAIALASAGLVFILVFTPFIVSSLQLVDQIQSGFRPENEWAYIPVEQAQAAAAFINRSAGASELVIASPALAWALGTQATDFQQALAFRGLPSVDYPANVPRDRFAYGADYERASFVVIDPIWREWGAVHLTEVAEMLEQIEGWPVAFEAGGVQVYRNPDK